MFNGVTICDNQLAKASRTSKHNPTGFQGAYKGRRNSGKEADFADSCCPLSNQFNWYFWSFEESTGHLTKTDHIHKSDY